MFRRRFLKLWSFLTRRKPTPLGEADVADLMSETMASLPDTRFTSLVKGL